MSRVGKQIIILPSDVTCQLDGLVVRIKGPKGELSREFSSCVKITITDRELRINVDHPRVKKERAIWGTSAAILKSMVLGVSEGFVKKLDIQGVGFYWKISGNSLTIKAGFSHPVIVKIPEGVEVKIEGEEEYLVISGADKYLVGQFAAEVRNIRPPEPYKGKGIRYIDEHVKRKAGKQVAGTQA